MAARPCFRISRGASIAAAEIDGQNDRHRQRGGDARQPRHHHAEHAVRGVIRHFEQRGHGAAGHLGDLGGTLQGGRGQVHRSISKVALSAGSAEMAGTACSWSRRRRLWFKRAGRDLLSGRSAVAIAGARTPFRGNSMSVQMVLLPVFVLVGLDLRAAAGDGRGADRGHHGRQVSLKDIALRQPNWPEQVTQIGNASATSSRYRCCSTS